MRVPLQWLKEFIDLRVTPEGLAERLTMGGIEVEAVERTAHDIVLTLAVMPNRPDCLSIRGVAREGAALKAGRFRERVDKPPVGQRPLRDWVAVKLHDRRRCPRYAARVIEGVRVGPSPANVHERLEAAGIRPINNVVDATNYVMWELGQPLHAFDARFIHGNEIHIQRAAAPTTFVTLDGVARTITPDDLLIADAEGPIALAGIMGGANSEVRDDTTRVVLESAYFHPDGIRRTSRRLGVGTESSRRFERGVDPHRVEVALHRVAELIVQWAGGMPSQDWVDLYPVRIMPLRIPLSQAEVAAVLGVTIPVVEMGSILTRLGCRVQKGRQWVVFPPTDRPDLTRSIDVIEEIARCRGYDRIPTTLPRMVMGPLHRPAHEPIMNTFRTTLVAWGFSETRCYSFMSASEARLFDMGLPLVSISNPLGQEPTVLKATLAPGLLEAVQTNVSMGNSCGRLFEIRRVFHQGAHGAVVEGLRLSGVMFGSRKSTTWTEPESMVDFYDVKGRVEGLLQILGLYGSETVSDTMPPFLHPGESCRCRIHDCDVGYYGMIHPTILRHYALEVPVGFFEIAVATVAAMAAERSVRFREIPRFPGVRRDVSLLIPAALPAHEVVTVMQSAGGPLLRKMILFDVYRGEQIGASQKSVTYALYYQDPDRTLTDEEVNRVQQHVVEQLRRNIGAEIR